MGKYHPSRLRTDAVSSPIILVKVDMQGNSLKSFMEISHLPLIAASSAKVRIFQFNSCFLWLILLMKGGSRCPVSANCLRALLNVFRLVTLQSCFSFVCPHNPYGCFQEIDENIEILLYSISGLVIFDGLSADFRSANDFLAFPL
jgi:hypothetical protein